MAKRKKRGACYQFAETGSCTYGTSCQFQHVALTKTSDVRDLDKPKTTRTRRITSESDPVVTFFTQYPEFDYNEDNPIVREFYRMCDYFGWVKNDPDRNHAHEDFKTAMVLKFNSLYGTDVKDIESWHKLCVALNISPLPLKIKDCKKIVRRTHVNLVDLVDDSTEDPRIFNNVKELRKYTIRKGKYFPKESAHAGGVLKFLLRDILTQRPKKTTKSTLPPLLLVSSSG